MGYCRVTQRTLSLSVGFVLEKNAIISPFFHWTLTRIEKKKEVPIAKLELWTLGIDSSCIAWCQHDFLKPFLVGAGGNAVTSFERLLQTSKHKQNGSHFLCSLPIRWVLGYVELRGSRVPECPREYYSKRVRLFSAKTINRSLLRHSEQLRDAILQTGEEKRR